MRWFDTPPCPSYEISQSAPSRLLLRGPSKAHRLGGGVAAAFGGVFTSMALPFARLPVPMPFRLVPLALAAAGGAITAVGGAAALSSASLEVTRAGLTMRWKLPGFAEKVVRVSASEIAGLEVTTHAHRTSSDFGGDDRVIEHRLALVTRAGDALELESFHTRLQADLRKQAVEAVLGG